MPRPLRTTLLAFAAGVSFSTDLLLAGEPIRPKVVVVATFEVGSDTGDRPGEFQFWVERERLTNTLDVPGVDRPLRWREDGLFGCVSGTTVRAGLQIQALGLDPRFDFSHTYWLVNGIAGVDPENASVGAAAWARWVVDGDIAYELDPRDAPRDWPYGLVPLGGKRPNDPGDQPAWAPKPMAWKLNPSLVEWAFQLTRDTVLADSPEARVHRALFTDWAAAQRPASVLLGESLGSCRYFHGARMTEWANDWVKRYTGGEGDFVMTDMEDHGIAAALSRLDALGRVDFKRVLFLRTASNFCVPPPGQTAAQSMTSEYHGMLPALESAYAVGGKVVHHLIDHWAEVETQTPTVPGK
jgi:purine nucleoside permease